MFVLCSATYTYRLNFVYRKSTLCMNFVLCIRHEGEGDECIMLVHQTKYFLRTHVNQKEASEVVFFKGTVGRRPQVNLNLMITQKSLQKKLWAK